MIRGKILSDWFYLTQTRTNELFRDYQNQSTFKIVNLFRLVIKGGLVELKGCRGRSEGSDGGRGTEVPNGLFQIK